MTLIRYELELMSRLMDRANTVCAAEGINLNTFVELAIREAVLDSERRSTHVRDALRTEDEYPYGCIECGRKFKLPMHLGNHMAKSHGVALEPPPGVTPIPLSESLPEPVPAPEPEPWTGESVTHPESEPFKLGVDPSLIEMTEPRQPVQDAATDFLFDVPSL